MRIAAIFGLLLAGAIVACSPPVSTAGPSAGTATPASSAVATTPGAGESTAPSAAVGFAFDAESIAGYYRTLGYTCTDPHPSAQAAGYLYRSCQLIDPAGRTRVIGLVTDAADELADAFASIQGKAGETVLDPTVALEPFAAFLGATLGPVQGESLLPWLASKLGDAYRTTTIADLTVATYSATAEDHSKLYVEIANAAYMAAPRPSAR